MKFRATVLSCQASALGLLIPLTSCGDKPTEPAAKEVKRVVAAIDGKAKPSSHFVDVAKHLDQGGIFYGYIDIDGDLNRLLEFGQKAMDTIRDETGADIPDLNLDGLVSPLGLKDITAMGASSVGTSADSYRNQMFIHTPEGAKGLMTLFGKESSPLLALNAAPAGSDIVIEQEFRLNALKEVALGIWPHLPPEAGAPPLEQMLQMEIPNVGMTASEVIDKMNGRALFSAKFSDTEKLTVPIDGNMVTIPAFDFTLDLRGLGWIFEKFGPMIPQGGPFQREEADGVTTLTMQVPPNTPFSMFQPILIHDQPNNRLVLSTTPAFLAACEEGNGEKITSDASYVALSQGLPTEGNAFSYFSPRLKDILGTVVKDAMAQEGAPEGATKIVDFVLESLGGVASVSAHTEDGIHTVANSGQSFKSSAAVALMVFPAAALMGARTLMNAQLASEAAQTQDLVQADSRPQTGREVKDSSEDMGKILTAMKQHALKNNGAFPDTLTDLVPDYLTDESALKWRKPNGEETALVYFSGLSVSATGNPVLLAAPEPDGNDQRTVGRLDGTTEQISEDDFFKAARAAIEQSQ